MKANEFVKKHGLDKALEVVNRDDCIYAIAVCVYEDSLSYSVSMAYGFTLISDLKRLIDSHELVREHGSIERAKDYAQSQYTDPEVYERLNQAITNVESCL